ncbi:MAG: DUF1634 domain-containing protein [Cyanobacteria bacterium REEB67]|nr:DUF1634 domain-containing protein [Cyanobacteria bacterium REEB67]
MKAEKMELTIARLLSGGLLISAAIIACGVILLLFEKGAQPEQLDLARLHGIGALSPGRFLETVQAALTGRAEDVLEVGLICLVATPVMRVFLSIFLFARRGDFLYVAITTLVLAVLIFAFLNS